MATRKLVERVTARVFCHGSGGGNPVTIFASQHGALSRPTQQRLAKECDWESVMVSSSSSSNSLPEMSFYMPSGEPVSFCAHAALGGAVAVAPQSSEFSFQTAPLDDGGPTTNTTHLVRWPDKELDDPKDDDDDVSSSASNASAISSITSTRCLYMQATFDESPVSHPPSLQRLLREHLGISSAQLMPASGSQRPPTFVNASIARPKTLVYVNSIEALALAKAPTTTTTTAKNNDHQQGAAPSTNHRNHTPNTTTTTTTNNNNNNTPQVRTSFASACGAIDDSTGIYLYAAHPTELGAWECRQFPRASGYPEDPATGIAAAALAVSLHQHSISRRLATYSFYQGTNMGRPSLIRVVDLETQKKEGIVTVSFGLQGRVEMDHREMIEVEDC